MRSPPRYSLRGVEVKHTTANVTINSEDVLETLDGFVDLVDRNRERKVHLHFLSTSQIGLERAPEDRAKGVNAQLLAPRNRRCRDRSPANDLIASQYIGTCPRLY